MKETKVYVEEMPDMCLNCPCLDGVYCNILCDNVFIGRETRDPKCKLQSIKTHNRELVKEVCEKIIKFINELAWKDVQYDAYQSTMGEFTGSRGAIPRYAKKYFDLWKEMFGEDLDKKD